jgi:stage V sporulation protein G
MEITEVRVFPVNEDKLKAYATITFDDCFVVRDLKVIHGNSGLFVAMPSKKRKDGTFKDVAHPLNNEFRSKIEQKVLDAYEAERAAAVGGPPKAGSPGSEIPPEGNPPPQD